MRLGSHGLQAWPRCGRCARSARRRTRPCAARRAGTSRRLPAARPRSRSRARSSLRGSSSRSPAGLPCRVVHVLVGERHAMQRTLSPCRRASARSAALAAVSASSASTRTKALSVGCQRSMRASSALRHLDRRQLAAPDRGGERPCRFSSRGIAHRLDLLPLHHHEARRLGLQRDRDVLGREARDRRRDGARDARRRDRRRSGTRAAAASAATRSAVTSSGMLRSPRQMNGRPGCGPTPDRPCGRPRYGGRCRSAISDGLRGAAHRLRRTGSGCGSGSPTADRSGSADRRRSAPPWCGGRDRATAWRRAARAYRDGARPATAPRPAPVSTTSPRYITITRSLMKRTTLRSCEMNT